MGAGRLHAMAVIALSAAFWASGDAAPPRVLNIVAHPDDDLLFMSPDLFDDVTAGSPVLTVYLSAGDGARERSYWGAREDGAMAAHARLVGAPNEWTSADGGIPDRASRMVTLNADPDIRLLFLRMPDGWRGCGSCRYDQESLQRLWQGDIDAVRTVDGAETWDRGGLVAGLAAVIAEHGPGLIRIQDPIGDFGSSLQTAHSDHVDHSDHLAAGRFAMEAIALYGGAEVHAYLGYPVDQRPENVSTRDLRRKEYVFSAYSPHDDWVCQDKEACTRECSRGKLCYPAFLARQYEVVLEPGAKGARRPVVCKPCDAR